MRTIGLLTQVLRSTLALSLVFMFSGCATLGFDDDSSEKTLWEREHQYIRIVPQDDKNAPPNDHPVSLSSDQIAKTLYLLQVNFQKRRRAFSTKTSQNQAVFTEELIELLADNLSRGLREAGPKQDIIFGLVGYFRIGLASFLRVRRVITGRVFYHDDRLNIIFGHIRGDHPEPKGAGAMVAIPAVVDMAPGSRTTPRSVRGTIQAEPGITVYANGSQARQDWVKINPAEAIASAEARRKRAQLGDEGKGEESEKLQQEATRLESEQQALREKVDQLEDELETVKQEQSQEGGIAAGVAAGTAAGVGAKTTVESQTAGGADATTPERAVSIEETAVSTPVSETEATTLEQQLAILKRLRDQDLISEDVYRARVEKLLDEAL